MKQIFHFKGRLIDDVVGFSTVPEAGDETLTCVIGFLSYGNCVQDVSL